MGQAKDRAVGIVATIEGRLTALDRDRSAQAELLAKLKANRETIASQIKNSEDTIFAIIQRSAELRQLLGQSQPEKKEEATAPAPAEEVEA